MSERPLEVGEMGILQNLSKELCDPTYLNETIAEILSISFGEIQLQNGKVLSSQNRYQIRDCEGEEGAILFWQIRRITDPDATQTTEHDEVLTA